MDDIRYNEFKLLLRPERFFDPDQFQAYWKKVEAVAARHKVGVGPEKDPFRRHVREVLFYDTPGADLYKNSFILRKRIFYTEGWPDPDHELTLKFRHAELAVAAGVDVTPHIAVRAQIKFKEELLPLKTQLGGMRRLYSHNCELSTPQLEIDQGVAHIASVFPCLERLVASSNGAPLSIVNNLPVEEIMVDPGLLDFGHGFCAKATIALWRNRASESSIVGEFAFQAKFDDYNSVNPKAKERAAGFFTDLQLEAPEWVALGSTKTAMVYQFGGQPQRGAE